MKKTKENIGISLISLVITIIVLLILLTISISMLTGNNSLFKNSDDAKVQTEISEEKNILKASAVSALGADKTELLKENNLKYYLDSNIGDEGYILEKGVYEDSYLVTFIKNNKPGRQYLILGDGTVLESGDEYYILKLQPNSIPNLEIGNTTEISAITNLDGEITWSSSNPNVATIEQDENNNTRITVIGKEIGVAQITATISKEGITRSAYCNIEVIEANSIKVLSVELDKTNEIIDLGTDVKTLQLTAKINPEFANNGTELTWTSSNPNVAMVDNNGLVTGVTNGTTVITVKTSNNKTATCIVTVQTTTTGIELSPTKATLDLNGTRTLQLTAKVFPEGANIGNDITWTSSNTNIAIVDNSGLVTGISKGTATITAKTANGYTATSVILCYTPITSIVLNPTSETIYIGNGIYSSTVQINAIVTPSNTDENITWTTSNSNVAKVSDTGLVTAVSTGTVIITAKNPSGTIQATSTITIKGQYTISYNANGGNGAPASQTKAQGINLRLSSVKPTRSNYTFQGWATSPSGSAVYQPQGTYTSDADITLYAVWKRNSSSSGGGGSSCRKTTVTKSASGTMNGGTAGSWSGTAPSGAKSVTISWKNSIKAAWRDRTFTWSYSGNGSGSWSSTLNGSFGNSPSKSGTKTIQLNGSRNWRLSVSMSKGQGVGIGSNPIGYSLSVTLTFNCN